MTDEQREPERPSSVNGEREAGERRTDEDWIDESMAQGDIANGEGDPEQDRTTDR